MRKMMIAHISILVASVVAGLPISAEAQFARSHDQDGLRGFHGIDSGLRITRSFESDSEARLEFEKILAAVGLKFLATRIELRASAQVSNAAAGISKQRKRFIFYNSRFMQRVKQRTADDWAPVSILAHESGHHLAFHTEISGRWHEFELEADYFSGFVLRRLLATLDQAQAAMRNISPIVNRRGILTPYRLPRMTPPNDAFPRRAAGAAERSAAA